MASRSDIMAGRAYVELYVKKDALENGLAWAKRQLQAFGSAMTTLGSNMFRVGAATASAFAGLAGAFVMPIKAAGDLMETTSKFEAVFGDASDSMKEFAATYANTVGRAKSETMASLATMQSFFLGMGLDPDKAAEFAKQMASASVDFASFHNLSDTESMQRFISALSGSGEVLSMFGVNIMQAALDQQLLAMGFQKSTAGATEMQKVLARIAIIQKTMSKQGATGDAERTVGSFSNQMKALQGSAISAAEAIGNTLLPVITPLVTEAARVVKIAAAWVAENKGLVVTIAKIAAIGVAAGAGIAALGAAIMAGGTVLTAFATILGVVKVAVVATGAMLAFLVTPIGLVGVALTAAGVYWLRYTESGQQAIAAIMEAIRPFVNVVSQAIAGVRDALIAGDLGLAGKIAMTALQLAFEMGKQSIVAVWFDVRDQMMGVWDTIVVESAAAIAYVNSLWGSISDVVQEEIALIANIWNTFVGALMESDFGKALAGSWEGFRSAAAAAFEHVMFWANALIGAINTVRGEISRMIEVVVATVPEVALTGADVGLEATVKINTDDLMAAVKNDAQLAQQLITDELSRADIAANDARDRVGGQRNELREKREARGDEVRNAGQEKIRGLQVKLGLLTHKAMEERLKLGAKKEEERKAAGVAGEPVAPEKQKLETKALGSTFSAAAAIAMGRGGAGEKPELAIAKKQAADLAAMKDSVRKLPEILREANDFLSDIAAKVHRQVARMGK